MKSKTPWSAGTDAETDIDDGISKSEFEIASTMNRHGPGESMLFFPGVAYSGFRMRSVSRR